MALNDKKIIAALSMIDDDLIEEAASASKKAPKHIWIRYAAAAACICIAAMFALRAGPFTANDSAAGGSAAGGVTSGTSAESSQNGFTGGATGGSTGAAGGSMYPSSDKAEPDGSASEDFTLGYTELTGKQKELALGFCLVSDDGLTSSSPVYDILTGQRGDGDVKDAPEGFAGAYPSLDVFAAVLGENGRYVYASVYASDSVGIVEGMSNKGYSVSAAASPDLYVLGGDASEFIGLMRTKSDTAVFAETPAGNVLLFYHTVYDGMEYLLMYTDSYENFISGSDEFEMLIKELSNAIYSAG